MHLAAVALLALVAVSGASAAGTPVVQNVVASSPLVGGGYPVPAGATRPDEGTCRAISLNSNHSESWLAVRPGTETLVGSSKFFVDRYSTFYDFHLGAYSMPNGVPSGNGQIMVAVSRDRGQTFSKPVQLSTPSASTPANTYVYPSVGPDGTVYVAFVGGFDTSNKNRVGHVYVAKSTDDGESFGPFVLAATPVENPNGSLANTRFRDGIIENFTSSQTYPGHVFLTYENYDPSAGTMDVYFEQSTDGGNTWSAPMLVNDDASTALTDQFQPSVATGPGKAVAVAFYDRRAACPADASISTPGAANTCIAVSLQAYSDSGTAAGATPVGRNVNMSQFAWDPEQPAQNIGDLPQ